MGVSKESFVKQVKSPLYKLLGLTVCSQAAVCLLLAWL